MAQQTLSGFVRTASTLSILWGVSLIILGILAVGSPFITAVAVNVVIAWLIVLAGVVHLTVASHTRGRQSDLETAGRARICLLWCVPDCASSTGCGVTHTSTGIALSGRGHLEHRFVFRDTLIARIQLGFDRRGHHSVIGADDLLAMAVEFGLGDRNAGWREHDHQRRYAGDAILGGSQGNGHDRVEVCRLVFLVSHAALPGRRCGTRADRRRGILGAY